MSRLDEDLMRNVPTWWVMSRNIPPRAWGTCCLQNHWHWVVLYLTLLLSHSLVLMNFLKHIYSIQHYELSFDLPVSCQPQYMIFEVPAYIWSRWMLLTSYTGCLFYCGYNSQIYSYEYNTIFLFIFAAFKHCWYKLTIGPHMSVAF